MCHRHHTMLQTHINFLVFNVWFKSLFLLLDLNHDLNQSTLVVTRNHRCRSRQIFGVRKIFARIPPNLSEKFSGNSLCKYFLPHRSWTPSFGMTSKKRASCDSPHVGRQFFKVKQRWAPYLPVFSGNLPRFSTNQNFWGCDCTPASCTPASCTTARNNHV